jgi:16S rRNA (cytidine1402-2'-O)-methyltransferase
MEGFLPRRGGERRARLTDLAAEPRTMVFFEAPHRLAASLADMATVFGAERTAAVCRELTKTYEEVRRGGLAELAEWADAGVRGEITVVVAGAPATGGADVAAPTWPASSPSARAPPAAEGRDRRGAAELGVRALVFDAVVAAKTSSRRTRIESMRAGQQQGVLRHDADRLRQRRPAHRHAYTTVAGDV